MPGSILKIRGSNPLGSTSPTGFGFTQMPRPKCPTSLDDASLLVHSSCMSKTITIDDDVYRLLLSLKEGTRDSFTKVIRRHVHKPLETAGELLDYYEHQPPPAIDGALLGRVRTGRGRRSGGRK